MISPAKSETKEELKQEEPDSFYDEVPTENLATKHEAILIFKGLMRETLAKHEEDAPLQEKEPSPREKQSSLIPE